MFWSALISLQDLCTDFVSEMLSPPTGPWLMCFYTLHCRIIREQIVTAAFHPLSMAFFPSAGDSSDPGQHGASRSPSPCCILIRCQKLCFARPLTSVLPEDWPTPP
ncbi:hypothetical protein ILYODFUR_024114 [Ilyodon furcidens]|uniref:Uncharacterized protein n=1 Tax=Ilyodon furcidens TaxID=33524 RepID=A0ABV0V8J9_9TELE